MKRIILAMACIVALTSASHVLPANPRVLNYQGLLTLSGSPVVTPVEVTFRIYDDSTGGSVLWSDTRTVTPDADGRLNELLGTNTVLDESVFSGDNRYLSIQVTGDSEMSPRQRLAASPYSFKVGTVDGAKGGALQSDLSVAGRVFTTSLNVGPSPGLAANKSTAACGDNNSSDLGPVGANNNAVGPDNDLSAATNSFSVGQCNVLTTSGGTALGQRNQVHGDNGFAVGADNYVGAPRSITFGNDNNVQGGGDNVIFGDNSVIAAGGDMVIGGGYGDTIEYASDGVISGGKQNKIVGTSGANNSNFYSSIGGGYKNAIDVSTDAFPDPGRAVIAGGQENTVTRNLGTIGGGQQNTVSGYRSTIAGGAGNTASGDGAFIGGGESHTASGIGSVVAGGGTPSTFAERNQATADHATVGGGHKNIASGESATVPGGALNTAGGNYSLAAGRRAKANHDGAFVWADTTDADFASTADNQFLVRANGGVGIGTAANPPLTQLDVDGQITIRGGAPAAGKILTSDANGTATWQDPTSISTDNDWTLSGDVLLTDQAWGIGRFGSSLLGDYDSTQVNLGVACTTGTAISTTKGRNSACLSGENNSNDARSGVIAGGRANKVHGDYSFVGSGYVNRIDEHAEYSVIGGGWNNSVEYSSTGGAGVDIWSKYSTISGGAYNRVIQSSTNYVLPIPASTIGGGYHNVIDVEKSSLGCNTIAGGTSNRIVDSTAFYGVNNSTIGGGDNNRIEGLLSVISGGGGNQVIYVSPNSTGYTTISGGAQNTVAGLYGSVGGGFRDSVVANYGTIGGGNRNVVAGEYATIAGGSTNTASGDGFATIGGGQSNSVLGQYSTISGGHSNIVGSYYSTIGGGTGNNVTSTGNYGTIAGGQLNEAVTRYSTVGGGYGNTVGDLTYGNEYYGTIGGGKDSRAIRFCATVPGGYHCLAEASCSFAAGAQAHVLPSDSGTFLWSDRGDLAHEFTSAAANEFAVRSLGGVRFATGVDVSGVPNAGVELLAGSSTWSNLSDRNAKDNFRVADGEEILAKLSNIDISRWNYKTEDPSIRHIGPMAQDFYAAFGVGADNRHITTVDADGVALAAIKALNDENCELKDRVEKLEEIIQKLVADRQ